MTGLQHSGSKAPAISVIMAVYNGEKFLRQAIDSILNQTLGDFEFIIINDGSTDDTQNILESYSDPRIDLYQHENIGLTKSLNRGLKEAKGRYIARMDADDISYPHRFKKQFDFLEKNNEYAVVGSFVKAIDCKSKIIYTIEKPVSDKEIKEHLKNDNCIAHGSAFFRKKCIFDVGLYDESIKTAQDYDLFLRLSEKYRLANIPEYLYGWREHDQGISKKFRESQRYYVEFAKKKSIKNDFQESVYSIDNPPDFSVLMANYNNGKYIAEAIESVLRQTHKDWELIIIDDASNDNSEEIIRRYLHDKRIRYYKNEKNIGYIETLRRLIQNSYSDILGIFDSDDTLSEDAVESIIEGYRSNPDCGLIYSQFIYCDADLKPQRLGFSSAIPAGKSNLQCNVVSAFRTFKKHKFLETEGFDNDILYAEDKDLYFKMEEITKLFFLDKVLYHHRVLTGSQGNDPRKARIGKVSFTIARYKAFRRRQRTNIPNLKRIEITGLLMKALFDSVLLRDKNRIVKLLKMLITAFYP